MSHYPHYLVATNIFQNPCGAGFLFAFETQLEVFHS